MESKPLIVFFDGVCNVCNRYVDFLVRRADPNRIKVAPLQGKTAQDLLRGRTLPDSIVVIRENHEMLVESDAIIEIAWELGGVFRLGSRLIRNIPRSLRDHAYRLFARHRYRLFGKKETCRIPTSRDREFFLP